MKQLFWYSACALAFLMLPVMAHAQPGRQIPGTRPHLPGTPPANFPEANSRTRAANSGVGLESTDFYGKKGYPRILGDSVEASATGTNGNSGSAAGISGGGAAGVGGGVGGGIGGGALGSNLGFRSGFSGSANQPSPSGITGGGFSGLVPKGFGFGGTPSLDHNWLKPLRGWVIE